MLMSGLLTVYQALRAKLQREKDQPTVAPQVGVLGVSSLNLRKIIPAYWLSLLVDCSLDPLCIDLKRGTDGREVSQTSPHCTVWKIKGY